MLSINKLPQNKLLGEILEQAGLISDQQIQIALTERRASHHLRVREILALRGWIDQRTADFFADEWCYLMSQTEKQLLGYYLEKSGLLTKQQTNSILEEQKKIWVKFGAIAVLQGRLSQETVDFFLEHLFPLELFASPLIGRKINQQATEIIVKVINSAQKIPDQQSSFPQVDNDDIPWIG